MTFFTNRSTAVLICFIALIACVHAHPNGSEGFDDMDFTWISSMGSQFTDLIAHDQFANMTMMPAAGSSHSSSHPRPPASSSQPSQPRYVFSGSNMSNYASEFMGSTQSQYSTVNDHRGLSYPAVSEPQRQMSVSFGGQPLMDSGERPHFGMFHSHTQPIPIADPHGAAMDKPRLGQSLPISAPNGMTASQLMGLNDVEPAWSMAAQQMPIPEHSVDQFDFQTYSMAPLQAPQPLPIAFSMPSAQLEPRMSRSAPNVPEILSSDVTANYNFQSGMRNNSVGNMRGWIGRAPTIGDRDVLPRIDTNYLAPPEAPSANHSPTSASTTPSSAKFGGSRRKPWQMTTGDFVCFYCKAGFPTQGDLTHHLRSHAPYMSRQHVCTKCDKRFQYRKDLMRHLPKHDPNRKKYYCPYPGCKYHSKGFGRQDHLDRHMGSQHPHKRIDTPQQSL